MIFVFEECLEGNSDSCSKSNRSASSLEDYVYGYAVGFAEGMLAASESRKRRASKDRWETKGRQNLSARHLSERLFQLKVDDYLT